MSALNILVIEDDKGLLLSTAHTLKYLGHKAILAKDGKEGLLKLKEYDIDMVICDWVMPNMDGISFCQEIKKEIKNDKYIYFIMLTARDDGESLMIGLNAGADDFMTKPVLLEELRVRLAAGMEVKELKELLIVQRK